MRIEYVATPYSEDRKLALVGYFNPWDPNGERLLYTKKL